MFVAWQTSCKRTLTLAAMSMRFDLGASWVLLRVPVARMRLDPYGLSALRGDVWVGGKEAFVARVGFSWAAPSLYIQRRDYGCP
jgi:hypothetical protein